MIDMSTWAEKEVDVIDDLQLDPHNVRLEFSSDVTEGDIVQDLFSNEQVLQLVDGIAKVGYLTHEIPIVVKRGKNLVVVEGNRRVAALKTIQNPYLTPQFQPQITRIAAGISNREALRKIKVKIAPDDDVAQQLVGAIHTGSQRRAWSPNRQAAFFKAQLDAGKSAKVLIEQYPTVKVEKFVLRSRFLDVFASAEYDDLELKSYVRSRRFPVSILERLYPNSDFLRIMGLSVSADYEIKTSLPVDVFGRLAEKVVRDIKNRDVNTRRLNKADSDEYVEYLNELRELLDSESGAGSSTAVSSEEAKDFSKSPRVNPGTRDAPSGGFKGQESKSDVDNGGTSAGSTTGKAVSPASKTKIKNRKPRHLNTSGLTVPAGYPASIELLLGEVAKINVELYPNATMDLLRSFLEKSIKAHADRSNVNLRPHGAGGFVYFSHCLTWLEQHLRDEGNRADAQVVRKLSSDKVSGYYPGSKDALDAINHNHKFYATPDDVRNCWAMMFELMKVILAP